MTKSTKPLCGGCKFHLSDKHCHYAISTFYVNCETITECPYFEEKKNDGKRKT